tara:strand:+ start:6246 stop:6812 length:567 start_codon:yes stop_codon:yes gene_type:complete
MPLKKFILSNQVTMRICNQWFVYFIYLYHGLLNLMPPFIRNFGFKVTLGKCGKRVFFDYNVYIKYPWMVYMGDNVAVNRGVQFFPGFHGGYKIIIGNDVYLAPNVSFFASGHDLTSLTHLVGADIEIGDSVWIGANVTVLPGVTIKEGSVIGAGSIVTSNIPANSLAFGVPAKVIKEIKKNNLCETLN